MSRWTCSFAIALTATVLAVSVNRAGAEAFLPAEPATDTRVKLTACEVHIEGKVFTNAPGGKTTEHPLSAVAAFRYRERRLPPGGRDAQALRALREFELAMMQSRVADHDTQVDIPDALRLVVATGRREGILTYGLESQMTRDAVELLEIPGDPLALAALLPLTEVDEGDEWRPADWAAQMLCGIEAADAIDLNCRMTMADDAVAAISVSGKVTGQQQGANTEIDVSGTLKFDRTENMLRTAKLKFVIKTSIGTVSPGIDAAIDVTLDRSMAESAGRLTDQLADNVPLDATPQDQLLVFQAPPWGVRLNHDRNWHLFQALFEGTPRVVILRLMDRGSLICQCNISPVAAAAPGQSTPPEKFEADIQQALGDRFRQFVSREKIPTDDGRSLIRVVAEGELELRGENGSVQIPMNWIYYLCTGRDGRQVSFVFSIEPAYLEALSRRDVAMVESLRFTK